MKTKRPKYQEDLTFSSEYEAKELVPDNEELFLDVFNKLKNKYNFV